MLSITVKSRIYHSFRIIHSLSYFIQHGSCFTHYSQVSFCVLKFSSNIGLYTLFSYFIPNTPAAFCFLMNYSWITMGLCSACTSCVVAVCLHSNASVLLHSASCLCLKTFISAWYLSLNLWPMTFLIVPQLDYYTKKARCGHVLLDNVLSHERGWTCDWTLKGQTLLYSNTI